MLFGVDSVAVKNTAIAANIFARCVVGCVAVAILAAKHTRRGNDTNPLALSKFWRHLASLSYQASNAPT